MLHNLSIRNKLIVMGAVMSALFLVALDQTIVSTALAAIVKEFNSFSSLGFIVTAYMLTTTVTVPLAGKLSDMYGRKPLLLSGVAIFTIGSLLSGASPGVEWLIAWRALQGIGGGIITANAFTIIGDLFPVEERGKWQGMFGAVFGMSSVIGPLLGGWLTDGANIAGLVTDWRWTFLINVPIGIIAVIALVRYCPKIKHDAKHKPDYLGAILLTVSLAALVLAVDNTELIFKDIINNGVSLNLIKNILFILSALAALAFVWIEQRAKQPTLPLRFFKNKTYSLIIIVALLFGAAFLGSILYLTQFNQQVFGASASQAGLMLLPMVAGMMVSSLSTGQIVSRIGSYKWFITAGYALVSISMFSLTILQPNTPYWHEAVIMVFIGLGMGMCLPILSLAVQNEFTHKDLGVATSSVQLFRGLGSTIGTAIFAGVLTAGIINNIGDANNLPYIQTLHKSPQASKMLDGELNSDKLLQINSQHKEILAGAEQGFKNIPTPIREQSINQFKSQQDEYNSKILQSFSDSLHGIFIISASLMVVGCVITLLLPHKKLSSSSKASLVAD